MEMKENSKSKEDLTGKMCNFRGNTVLVIRKYKFSFPISDNLELQSKYDIMFEDGSIDLASRSSLTVIE